MTQRGNREHFAFKAGDFVYALECMGTVFMFKGASPLSEADTLSALQSAGAALDNADATFSTYKPESPVALLAAGKQTLADCPPEVAEVWNECEAWEKTTDGWFSPFTPEHTFDPSGLVKTRAARQSCELLNAAGFTNYTLNAGGDIYLANGILSDTDWRVAIHKPVSIASTEAGVLTVLDLKGSQYRAVCTSGKAERGDHIWDPKTYEFARNAEFTQVTVLAHDLVTADVWATAIYAAGQRGFALACDHNDAHPEDELGVLGVDRDGQVFGTPNLGSLIAQAE